MKELIALSLRNVSSFTSQAADKIEQVDTRKVGEFIGSVKRSIETELDNGIKEFKAQLPKKEVKVSKSIGKGIGILLKSGTKVASSVANKASYTINEFKEGYRTA